MCVRGHWDRDNTHSQKGSETDSEQRTDGKADGFIHLGIHRDPNLPEGIKQLVQIDGGTCVASKVPKLLHPPADQQLFIRWRLCQRRQRSTTTPGTGHFQVCMSSLRRWLGTRVHCRCIGPQVLPVVRTILQRDAQLPDVIVHALPRVVHSLLELSSSEAAPKPPGVCESLNEARLRLKGDSVHSEQSNSIADSRRTLSSTTTHRPDQVQNPPECPAAPQCPSLHRRWRGTSAAGQD